MMEKIKNVVRRIAGKNTPAPESTGTYKPETPVVLNSYSQPHVLQQRMKEEKMTHDQEVLANIAPVRLESNFGKMVMYFCPVQGIEITQKLKAGDGRELPEETILKGYEEGEGKETMFGVPKDTKPGLYMLKNVKLHSNGVLSVTATPQTEWEAI